MPDRPQYDRVLFATAIENLSRGNPRNNNVINHPTQRHIALLNCCSTCIYGTCLETTDQHSRSYRVDCLVKAFDELSITKSPSDTYVATCIKKRTRV
jgi:hypothetical protein